MPILVNSTTHADAADHGAVVNGLYAVYATETRQRIVSDTAVDTQTREDRESELKD